MMEKTCSEVAGAACYFDTHLHIYDIITVQFDSYRKESTTKKGEEVQW